LIKNSYQFKEYGSRRILADFSKIICKREKLDILLKKIGKLEALTRSTRGRPTKPGRPDTVTSFNTSNIQRDGSNTV